MIVLLRLRALNWGKRRLRKATLKSGLTLYGPDGIDMDMNDRFFLCYFETTRRCNLQCSGCMSRRPSAAPAEELTTDEAKGLVLDEIARISSNAAVAFSGGEHLLRPDALELLEHAARRNLWSFVNTNGRLLVETDAIQHALDATAGKVIFALSLNSTDAALNRSTRDDDPQTVLQAARRCEEARAPYFFIVTVSKTNLPTLGETVRFISQSGVPLLRSPFVPRGAGGSLRNLLFDAADMEQTIHPALSACPLSYVSFTPFFASPELIGAGGRFLGLRITGVGCQAARSFAAVGVDGQVAPCVHLLDSSCECGNARRERLSEIVGNAPLFVALRARAALKGKCGRCRYRDTCGGCRSVAYYQTGDVMGEDPTCFFEPVDPRSRSRLEAAQTAQLGKFLLYVKSHKPWNSLL
jgi:radical SAM protein with 4Fe4S-binding SPASM domain